MKWLRKLVHCSRGVHCSPVYDKDDDRFGICRAYTCSDCGFRNEGVTWDRPSAPKIPECKPPRPPVGPPCRTLKCTFGGLIETEESKRKTEDWRKGNAK